MDMNDLRTAVFAKRKTVSCKKKNEWIKNYSFSKEGKQKVFLNTLKSRQNGRYFLDNIFKFIFLNENVWISLQISLKFVPKVQINNIPALVQIMAWRQTGDKPLFEPMLFSLLTHMRHSVSMS